MSDQSFEKFFSENPTLMNLKEIFISNEFQSLRSLLEVTDEDLKDMGIKALGRRREFLAAIKEVTKETKSGRSSQDQSQSNSLPTKSTPDAKRSQAQDQSQSNSLPTKSTPDAKRSLDFDDVSNGSSDMKRQNISDEKKPSSSIFSTTPLNVEKILKAKNIDLYTEEEINKAFGVRRKKMIFMNNHLRKLMENVNNRAHKKSIIIGMAETAWDNFNATDSEIDIAKVESLMAKLNEKGRSYTEKQTKTIARLTDRLNRAKFDIKRSLKNISSLRENPSENKEEIKAEEKDLVVLHHELQKATDALRKACDIKIKELQVLLHDNHEYSEKDKEPNYSSDVSNSSIVNEILDKSD